MAMYCGSRDRQVLEDDLYQGDGDESETSEAISELEFHLYSQLHYSSNSGHLEAEDGDEQLCQEIDAVDKTTELAVDVDLEKCAKNRPRSLKTVKPQEQRNKSETRVKRKKGESVPEVQRPSPLFEHIIIIDSGPEVISISESLSSSSDDDYGVCASKGVSGLPLLTSTLIPKVNAELPSGLVCYGVIAHVLERTCAVVKLGSSPASEWLSQAWLVKYRRWCLTDVRFGLSHLPPCTKPTSSPSDYHKTRRDRNSPWS